MRVADETILALLEPLPFVTHDGLLDPPEDGDSKVVTYPLPYAVYYSSIGSDDSRTLPRLIARPTMRSSLIQLTYVGTDRNQAKWAGEQIRSLLSGQRITVPGYRSWLCSHEESQRIRRDDDAVRPDGSPLYYGVDIYTLAVSLTPTTI